MEWFAYKLWKIRNPSWLYKVCLVNFRFVDLVHPYSNEFHFKLFSTYYFWCPKNYYNTQLFRHRILPSRTLETSYAYMYPMCHTIFYDCNVNSPETLRLNVYQSLTVICDKVLLLHWKVGISQQHKQTKWVVLHHNVKPLSIRFLSLNKLVYHLSKYIESNIVVTFPWNKEIHAWASWKACSSVQCAADFKAMPQRNHMAQAI
jgi:hypothetical protein